MNQYKNNRYYKTNPILFLQLVEIANKYNKSFLTYALQDEKYAEVRTFIKMSFGKSIKYIESNNVTIGQLALFMLDDITLPKCKHK